ncbi:hypothetical protein VTO73DRAFT_10879 [Trametes versicolor]
MDSVLWRFRSRRQSVSYAFGDMHKDAPAHCQPQQCSPPPSLAPCASSTSYKCRGGTAIPTTTQPPRMLRNIYVKTLYFHGPSRRAGIVDVIATGSRLQYRLRRVDGYTAPRTPPSFHRAPWPSPRVPRALRNEIALYAAGQSCNEGAGSIFGIHAIEDTARSRARGHHRLHRTLRIRRASLYRMVAPRARLPTHPRFACGGVADIRGCHGSQMRLGLHGDITGLGATAVGPATYGTNILRRRRHVFPTSVQARPGRLICLAYGGRPRPFAGTGWCGKQVRTCPVFAVD